MVAYVANRAARAGWPAESLSPAWRARGLGGRHRPCCYLHGYSSPPWSIVKELTATDSVLTNLALMVW